MLTHIKLSPCGSHHAHFVSEDQGMFFLAKIFLSFVYRPAQRQGDRPRHFSVLFSTICGSINENIEFHSLRESWNNATLENCFFLHLAFWLEKCSLRSVQRTLTIRWSREWSACLSIWLYWVPSLYCKCFTCTAFSAKITALTYKTKQWPQTRWGSE